MIASPEETDARATTLDLLARRASGTTICPSEVAREIVAGTDPLCWRDAMPRVHAAIDTLLADGLIELSWQGKTLPTRRGPYRISAVRETIGEN